jgi:hypothetical protein
MVLKGVASTTWNTSLSETIADLEVALMSSTFHPVESHQQRIGAWLAAIFGRCVMSVAES